MTDSTTKKYRTLRAIEGEGEDKKTKDFEVKAAYLSVSEVLEPMSDKDEVLTSDDNVIPMHDSIQAVKALVGWLRRDASFEMTRENMIDLAILSDKYIIEFLRRDIENYTLNCILDADPPTLELWEFAARYSFNQLEQYCRKNKQVSTEILTIIKNRTQGIEYLINRQLPLSFVSRLVCEFM